MFLCLHKKKIMLPAKSIKTRQYLYSGTSHIGFLAFLTLVHFAPFLSTRRKTVTLFTVQ